MSKKVKQEKKQKTVSYSSYSLYKNCPYQWYLQYVKGPRVFIPSVNLVFGTSMHETLQLWLKVMYTQSGVAADQMDLKLDFKQRFFQEYKKRFQENNNIHFSTKEELEEFYIDGITLLDWISKRRRKYFTLRNTKLTGIEIPLLTQANKGIENLLFKGYIDFVLYHKGVKKYTIFDIKTSTRGWSGKEKTDRTKLNQILLYKKKFAEQKKISEEEIDVIFFIVKRKIYEHSEFPIPRVQEFKPASGKIKVEVAEKDFQAFLTNCYNPDGSYINKEYIKNPGDACRFCPFNDKPDLCDKINKG